MLSKTNYKLNLNYEEKRPEITISAVEIGLGLMVNSKSHACTCKKCASSNISYLGFGEYHCNDCNEEFLSAYGMIKKFIDENGAASIQKLVESTGVSGNVVRSLVEEGKIQRRGSMIVC